MKTKTEVSIYVYGLENSKNFEKKITNIINKDMAYGGLSKEIKKIRISDAGMKRKSGYGQYVRFLDVEINDTDFFLKEHSTDSMSFDYYNDKESVGQKYSNFIKGIVISIIESNVDAIINAGKELELLRVKIWAIEEAIRL